jgi:nitrogenase molybdenum-iron protein beta chain
MSIEQTQITQESCNDTESVIEAPRYSCSLGGAYACVLETTGAIPVFHSGGGCGFAQWWALSLGAGEIGSGRTGGANALCSSLLEEHVVFGGEKKLRSLIKSGIELMNGDLFVVIPGCIPAIVGDDVASVVSEFKEQVPIIHTNTSGFVGNSYDGYEAYLIAVIEQLLPKIAPEKQNDLVNIFGIAPRQHVFWGGDLQEIKRTFEKVGIKANILFGELEGLENLKKIPYATHNIVLSPWLGIKAAEKLKELYGTEYTVFPFVPVGPKETTRFLYQVGEKIGISKETLKSVTETEEKKAYRLFEFLGDILILGMPSAYYAVVADSNAAIGITRYLTNEVGYLPELVIITDTPPDESRKTIIKELTENIESDIKPEVIFEVDSHKIRNLLKNRKFMFLLASSMERFLAAEEFHAIHLSVSYPTWDRLLLARSYMGYRGGTALIEDMVSKYAGPM